MSSLSDFLNSGGALAPQVNQNTADIKEKSNPNELINGDFSVNQDGFSGTYSGEVYIADQWVATNVYGQVSVSTLPVSATHTLPASHYLRMDNASGSGRIDLTQRLEDPRSQAGVPMVLSFWADEDIDLTSIPTWYESTYNPTDGYNSSFSNGAFTKTGEVDNFGWERWEATIIPIAIRDNDIIENSFRIINLQFQISGTNRGVSAIKLERGTITTPFVPDEPAVNLTKCQRYYFIDDYTNNTFSPRAFILGDVAAGGTSLYREINKDFPTTMRKAPNTTWILLEFGSSHREESTPSSAFISYSVIDVNNWGGYIKFTADARL